MNTGTIKVTNVFASNFERLALSRPTSDSEQYTNMLDDTYSLDSNNVDGSGSLALLRGSRAP
jgi:hypothetical protein